MHKGPFLYKVYTHNGTSGCIMGHIHEVYTQNEPHGVHNGPFPCSVHTMNQVECIVGHTNEMFTHIEPHGVHNGSFP